MSIQPLERWQERAEIFDARFSRCWQLLVLVARRIPGSEAGVDGALAVGRWRQEQIAESQPERE